MILVYSEKPSMVRQIAPAFQKNFPNKNIIFINTMYIHNIYFNYPHKIKWKDYPYLGTPQYHFNSWEQWRPVTIDQTGTLIPVNVTTKDILEGENIIFAGEPDSKGVYDFSLFCKHILKKPIEQYEYPAIKLYALDQPSIIQAINEMTDFNGIFKPLVEYGSIKKYFDYLYNINSLGIFGSVLHHMKIDNNQHFMSKYMLLLLFEHSPT